MSTAEMKMELFRQIDQLDESNLKKIYNYLVKNFKIKNNDFWEELSELQKSDINVGLEDLKYGRKKDFHKVISSL